ncbi:hypothetical protein OGA32_000106 [Salmonella enterica]|nr:hypothetical protein [Salmonella enterica]
MANPNIYKHAVKFKPGNKANKNSSRVFKDDFFKFMGEIPHGVKPWEIVHQVITDPECTPDNKLKGSNILMTHAFKDEGVNIEVNAEQVHVTDIDERIKDMLKSQKELEAELAEEAKEDVS